MYFTEKVMVGVLAMKKISEIYERKVEFQRNKTLENYLETLQHILWKSEQEILMKTQKEYPFVFIMGAARSGTTLLLQWLAKTKEFSYPTNFLSRFYGAPIIGAMIQNLISKEEYRFRDELRELDNLDFLSTFSSNNGKTSGMLQPNEFWYLWRRFLPEDLWKYTNAQLISNVDIGIMRKEFLGIANVFKKPLAMKGMICNYHIEFLNQVFPNSVFIFSKRDIDKNVQSLLRARERQYGTRDHWYSFYIPEYEELCKISDPEEQVYRQICSINKTIENGLVHIPSERKIYITYEDFCKDPSSYYQMIRSSLQYLGYDINPNYSGEKLFHAR